MVKRSFAALSVAAIAVFVWMVRRVPPIPQGVRWAEAEDGVQRDGRLDELLAQADQRS